MMQASAHTTAVITLEHMSRQRAEPAQCCVSTTPQYSWGRVTEQPPPSLVVMKLTVKRKHLLFYNEMLLSENIRNELSQKDKCNKMERQKKADQLCYRGKSLVWDMGFLLQNCLPATVWPWVHVNLAVIVYFSIRNDDTFLGWLWRLKRYLFYVNMITCYGSIRMISQGPRKVKSKMKAISMNVEHKPQGVC